MKYSLPVDPPYRKDQGRFCGYCYWIAGLVLIYLISCSVTDLLMVAKEPLSRKQEGGVGEGFFDGLFAKSCIKTPLNDDSMINAKLKNSK